MKFLLTGDSLFSSSNLSNTIDPRLRAVLDSADAVFTNAEFATPRAGTSPAAGRGYQTSVRPKALKEFLNLNIRYVGFANNHTGDYGVAGILDTLEEAEAVGLIPLGIGRTLYDARKPVFLDTADGRIALITVDVTRSEVFAAADPGGGIPGRAGVNPLRWSRTYVVSPENFEAVKCIARSMGIDHSMREGKRIETFRSQDGCYDFGSLFEGYLTFAPGDTPHVKTEANEQDQAELLRFIRDASSRSDYVFVNLHTHEGENENWYSDYPPEFIEQFAHLAVDAGADCVFGHGAHFTRGIELYEGKPIFYNIGSLLMEFEAGESLISPEMYASYGYAANELPSTLHKNRAKDPNGNWRCFYSDPKFSENFLVQFDLTREKVSFELIPIDLRMTDPTVTKRGLPVLADAAATASLLERLNRISRRRYHTEVLQEGSKLVVRTVP